MTQLPEQFAQNYGEIRRVFDEELSRRGLNFTAACKDCGEQIRGLEEAVQHKVTCPKKQATT